MRHQIFYLSLDPVAEQVNCNSQSLKNLGGLVERLENKLSSLLDSITSTQHSYVTVASSVPPSQVTSPSSISAQKSTTSRTTTSHVREVNLYPKRVTFLSPKR